MSVDRIAAEWAARDRNPVAAMTTLPQGFHMTAVPQWIPVSQRLPERNEIVLVVDQGGVTVGSYSPMLDDWWTLQVDRMSPGAVVTHWRPLPEPPEVK